MKNETPVPIELSAVPLTMHAIGMEQSEADAIAADLNARLERNTTPMQRAAMALGLQMLAHDVPTLEGVIEVLAGRRRLADDAATEGFRKLAATLIEVRKVGAETHYMIREELFKYVLRKTVKP